MLNLVFPKLCPIVHLCSVGCVGTSILFVVSFKKVCLLIGIESGERPLNASNISQALECNTSTLLPEVCIGIFTGNSNLSFCCGLVRLMEFVNSENHSSDTIYQSSPSFGSSLRTGCNSVLNFAVGQKGIIRIRFSTKFSENFNVT